MIVRVPHPGGCERMVGMCDQHQWLGGKRIRRDPRLILDVAAEQRQIEASVA